MKRKTQKVGLALQLQRLMLTPLPTNMAWYGLVLVIFSIFNLLVIYFLHGVANIFAKQSRLLIPFLWENTRPQYYKDSCTESTFLKLLY